MMKTVNTTPEVLKYQIEEAIAKAIADYRQDYPINTGFTHKSILNMKTMIHLLLSMQGGSLKKELYDAGMDVTASAFIQQRNKIPFGVFEDVFEYFNANCNDIKKYKGYRVLAIDGTTVNMARNPKSESSCRVPAIPKDIIDIVNNIHEYKVNTKMAMYLCRQFFRTKDADEKKLIRDISKYLEPVRPNRRDTRNVKAQSFVGFVYRVSAYIKSCTKKRSGN